MYKFTWTKKESDFKEWNQFLVSTPQGHYSQISHWLKSYKSYGFDYDLLIVRNEENKIIGGLGVVISKFSFLKLCSCSCGPIVKKDYTFLVEELIEHFKNRAIAINATCCQIMIPILKFKNKNIEPHCLDIKLKKCLATSNRGNIIKSVAIVNGFREVKIDNTNNNIEEDILKTFNKNTRRNIKRAYKNELIIKYAKTINEIKNAYRIIELNAKTQGYPLRSWEDFKDTLIEMVNDDICLIPVCLKNEVIKGALIVIQTGKRLTYISGGTIREKEDLKTGHFLHYEMIKLSIKKKYNFYDISVGGSKGVTKFKEGFGGNHVKFNEPLYWVLNKEKFYIYEKTIPYLKKHKKTISKIIKFFK
ncbi:lipid II:glycine glycyltransferase FemX [Algibacter pectinivorans]|uniref:FemAB family protein n=1 Tax=Algibacter pectinivorans TaxID=870482 RepID=A0A1I1RMI3_9FLAO|nr:peptidoglycan bridge formation glycyltransferase FemA/FemB family protein [Algibacter pectinivorans]SFD35494.1 FemAB family protein [Algibacter pectinivorans]